MVGSVGAAAVKGVAATAVADSCAWLVGGSSPTAKVVAMAASVTARLRPADRERRATRCSLSCISLYIPCHSGTQRLDIRGSDSCGRRTGLPGSDTDGLLELADEYAAIAAAARSRDIGDRFEHRLHDRVVHGNFHLGPGPELSLVDFGDRDALDAQLRYRLPQLVQLERPHDRGDHFHDL